MPTSTRRGYGAPLDPATGRVEPQRDAFELAVSRALDERGIPIIAAQWHPELLASPQPLFAWLVARVSLGHRA